MSVMPRSRRQPLPDLEEELQRVIWRSPNRISWTVTVLDPRDGAGVASPGAVRAGGTRSSSG